MPDPDAAPPSRSDADGIQDRAEFAEALTALRERAGLTVRQVAATAGVTNAHSTVGDWFVGRGLPSLALQDLFVQVLVTAAER